MLLKCKVRKQFICDLKTFGAQGIRSVPESKYERIVFTRIYCIQCVGRLTVSLSNENW